MTSSVLRAIWLCAGVLALVLGLVGVFLPLLPTTPFVLLAAACFARGCEPCERRMLAHPTMGPVIVNWRAHGVIPLKAKQWATAMMAVSCAAAAWMMPRWQGVPAVACALVALWMLRQPSAAPAPSSPVGSSPNRGRV